MMRKPSHSREKMLRHFRLRRDRLVTQLHVMQEASTPDRRILDELRAGVVEITAALEELERLEPQQPVPPPLRSTLTGGRFL